jgi:uncharacterized integral membrane protein
MPDTTDRRHGTMFGALLLIALGALFLYANHRPDFDVWFFLGRYWPLILIFLGLGKLWDYFWHRSHPDSPRSGEVFGILFAVLILALILAVAVHHPRHWGTRSFPHETQSVIERQGAQSVRAHLEMPAGMLRVSGGASQLLDADFDYDESQGTPGVEYSVSGGVGQLEVRQEGGSHVRLGVSRNSWNLHFSEDVPLDMTLNMGAGEGDLRLRGLKVTHLKMDMGAGQLNLDLTGSRNQDLQAELHGGVGTATIRLPKNVGVKVHAEGGIGAVNVRGLKHDDGDYVNDAYGTSPVTINMNVQGGVGTINLEQEP